MWNAKDVYYISDGTGILATNLGQALICQFQETNFYEEKFPFIKTVKDAQKTMAYILRRSGGRRPLIFCTIIDPEIRKVLNSPQVEFFDAFGKFLDRLEGCMEAPALRVPGFSHHFDDMITNRRVEAIHFCLEHDDGTKPEELGEADVILLGVSRTGKTPISVYIATQMGLKTANFPLTTEFLAQYRLPAHIMENVKRTVGLTTTAELLSSVRRKRYPASNYAKLATCLEEIDQAEQIFQKYHIPTVNIAEKSIEETATQVLHQLGISRKPSF